MPMNVKVSTEGIKNKIKAHWEYEIFTQAAVLLFGV